MSCVVVTDSTAYIPPALLEQYHIRVIPLHVIWEPETFLDGVTIDPLTFYTRLAADKQIPTTTQPSIGEFVDFFVETAPEAKALVGVFISSELSGTVASALAAREMLPDRTIEVVDSRSTTMGLGFVALAAAQAAAQGKSLAEVVGVARQLAPRTHVLFVVETLEYLHRGGRIGSASRWLGTALRIKPLLHLNEGRVDALERVRTGLIGAGRVEALLRCGLHAVHDKAGGGFACPTAGAVPTIRRPGRGSHGPKRRSVADL